MHHLIANHQNLNMNSAFLSTSSPAAASAAESPFSFENSTSSWVNASSYESPNFHCCNQPQCICGINAMFNFPLSAVLSSPLQFCCNQIVCSCDTPAVVVSSTPSTTTTIATTTPSTTTTIGVAVATTTTGVAVATSSSSSTPIKRPGVYKKKRRLFEECIKVPNAPKKPKIKRVFGEGKKMITFKQQEKKMPCIICNKMYVSEKFLQRHKMLKHKLCKVVLQLKCDHCASIFSDLDAFEQHAQETETYLEKFYNKTATATAADQEDEDKGHYKCPQCDFVGNLTNIQSHLTHCNN